MTASATSIAGPVTVDMKTSEGTIRLQLDADKAPITVESFLRYAKDGHYDGLTFHRVIPGFMIQGGGYDVSQNQRKTRDNIKNEGRNGLSNTRGTIAMARTPEPHSASSQFFINLQDNSRLDAANSFDTWGYAVFGEVVADSMTVVDKIAAIPTGAQGAFRSDVPTTPVIIESVTVVEDAK